MNFINDNGSMSDSLNDSSFSISLPDITENGIFTIIEYIVIIIILIIFCYVIYKIYSNREPVNTTNSSVQIPDLRSKTILDALRWCAKVYSDFPALMVRKDNGNWSYITYEDYYKNCMKFAKELNYWVGSKTKVAILGFNSPAWFYSHLGCLYNSGISIGIYPTSSSDTCQYILNHSEIDVLVVEDGKQLEKIIEKDIPTLKLILYYSPISDDLVKMFKIPVVSFGAFMESNEKSKIKISDRPKPDNIATIIYTSGTTGDPKGAIITHRNITSTVNSVLRTLQSKSNLQLSNGERFVSYLPLNHIAAQMMDIYVPICTLGTVWFADKDALKSTLVNTLRDARPTIFIGVPRVWEKMKEKIEDKKQSNYFARNLPTILTRNKIINDIGLNKCKYCITAAAPISEEARDYFESLNLYIYDIYGLSETTGPITISAPGFNYKGSVGMPIDDVRIKISSDGEILVKSRSIFKGYYKDPKSTNEAFKDSWFKTGDIGYIKNGFVFITSRKKEILITSAGENISPIPIEQEIQKNMPEFEHVILVGDKRKFLSVILVPKMKGENAANCFKKIDPDIKLCKDLITNKKVTDYINDCINKTNSLSKSNANKVQKWIIIDNEFTVGQELTPTLKLRRYFVNEKYKDKIDKLYLENNKIQA